MNPRLSTGQVLELHGYLLSLDGGLPGVRDLGLLESALAQPCAEIFGELRYPTALEQACAYWFFLIKNHAFNDGNKRTATACALLWLDLSGYALERPAEEIAAAAVSVAADDWGYDQLLTWLHSQVRLFP